MLNKLRKKLRKIKFIYEPYKKFRINQANSRRRKQLHKNGYKILEKIIKTCKREEINIFCAYGTALGFVRDGGFIEHDTDMDFGIIFDKNFSWNKLDKTIKSIGLKRVHGFKMNDKVFEVTYKKNSIFVDFFLYYEKEDNLYSYSCFKKENYEYLNDNQFSILIDKNPKFNKIIYKNIHGIEIPLPENVNDYLESIYGKTWRKIDPNFIYQEEELKDIYAEEF